MRRRNGIHITPRLQVSRSELAGAWLATAGETGLTIQDARRLNGALRNVSATHVLADVGASAGVPLGIALCNGDCRLTVASRADHGINICAHHTSAAASEHIDTLLADTAEALHRQLIFRRIVLTLRFGDFLLLERTTYVDATIMLRARMPATHHLRPSARTAPPDFAIEITPTGDVRATMRRLNPRHRRAVEETLHAALVQTTSSPELATTTLVGVPTTATDLNAKHRPPRVDAA
ncbi:MAG: hypothetical protein H6817_06685 [Phycisphaerales bacterium]|nr:hypothetical protein [Phycisphaerales bacterium]